ncbi:MBL fold metallo-hydrolase [Ornithinibacillus sp. FSL M8-0202]|uniref:MBL fold metallo-hydrolase n=1 Tax=unclassified Ornithinibacillus TaxID=2620869 RepID=UPI0030D40BF7
MEIKQFQLGPLGTNCYLVHNTEQVIIIDPGGDGKRLMNWLTENNLEPIAILLTHAHFDHIGAVELLRTHYNIKVYMHKEEATWLEDPSLNRSLAFIGEEIITSAPDVLLGPGNFSIGPFEFDVLYTPGHSPGSISFLLQAEKVIFSGDVLFNRGIGRTDLPGGDFATLQDTIWNTLYTLTNDITVYPGHGPTTTIGEEKRYNPFIPQK